MQSIKKIKMFHLI